MSSLAVEVSVESLFSRANTALAQAAEKQRKAEEAFEQRRHSCSIDEYMKLKAGFDQANETLALRQKECDAAEKEYLIQLSANEKEQLRLETIARREKLNKEITEQTEKIDKLVFLQRELPDQLARLVEQRNLLLRELVQVQEVN